MLTPSALLISWKNFCLPLMFNGRGSKRIYHQLTNKNKMRLKHNIMLEGDVRQWAQTVYDALGPGYNECVYHKAMEVLLRKQGVQYESERIVPIVFEGHTIGNVRSDIIVDGHT